MRYFLAALNAALNLLALLSLMFVALLSLPAFAQAADVAAVDGGMPGWLKVLGLIVPGLVFLVVATHAVLKLADKLHAEAIDAQKSALQRTLFLAGESLARSVDHYLELTQADFADLFDESKRAAAVKHLEDQAKVGALPAVSDAMKAMGSNWLAGAASAAVDAATTKAALVPQKA